MAGGGDVILTPDQRLRVFVSSTLRELAPERRVIRDVIERLALAPVMFELGARPHPPRSLYRAYLEQSDIFIGVYWESYGWVAPGEEVSGLEDEYDLAPDVPMLMYVKRSEQRQDRLESLLDRIRDDDRASYVAFDDIEQLGPLVTADLAILLAERFDESRRRRAVASEVATSPASSEFLAPPRPLTRLIAREDDLQRVVELLTTDGCRMVTLTGPGGIGKTRLALAAAHAVDLSFPDGTAFVDLAPLRDPGLVLSAIATAVGIRDTADTPLHTKLTGAFAGRRVLLLLDNVEHVIAAATDLSALLHDADVVMLATSRTLLRIEGEQIVPLAPLPSLGAVQLFVERARAVKPDFSLSDDNADHVGAIVAALDNVPLALELAAARVRVFTPAELAARLDTALPLLVGGPRDSPTRQRTLRDAIDWSARLLSNPERGLFLRVAVFRNGFSLDAAEWMSEGLDVESAVDLLAALVDSSLVQAQDRGSRAWFSMLATVREYARDELERRGDLQACRQRHAEFFGDLAARAEPHLIGPDQSAWLARLTDEFEDFRGALDYYFSTGQGEKAADLLFPLYWFWWIAGRIPEAADWAAEIVSRRSEVTEHTYVTARLYVAGLATLTQPDPNRIAEFEEYLAYFHREDDKLREFLTLMAIGALELMSGGAQVDAAAQHLQDAQTIAQELRSPFLTSMALQMSGQATLAHGDVNGAIATFQASVAAAKDGGEVLIESSALHQLGWVNVALGEHDAAREYFVEQMLISSTVGHEEGLATALEGLSAVSVAGSDFVRAGRLLGASEDIRDRKGVHGPGMSGFRERILAQVTSTPHAREFELARAEGRRAELSAMVEEALSPPRD